MTATTEDLIKRAAMLRTAIAKAAERGETKITLSADGASWMAEQLEDLVGHIGVAAKVGSLLDQMQDLFESDE